VEPQDLTARRDVRRDHRRVFVRIEPVIAIAGMPVRAYYVKETICVSDAFPVKLKTLTVEAVVD
jgi:hypothetical protein